MATPVHFRESKASSDDDRGADVIEVNVVVLRSKSSRALHRHLSSAGSTATAGSASNSREDVSAKEVDKSFMQASVSFHSSGTVVQKSM